MPLHATVSKDGHMLWTRLPSFETRCGRQVATATLLRMRSEFFSLSAKRRAAVATQVRRLIGDARVIGAVGQAGHGLAAAEEEVGAARIADRPAAGHLVQLEQRAPLADRNDVVEDLG